MSQKCVLFSFDLEEFDMPLEYGYSISFDEQIAVSRKGTELVLTLLEKFNVPATFFSTCVFAEENVSLIKTLAGSRHELASHSYYHSKFSLNDLLQSKRKLEEISGKIVTGFRMPRMKDVDQKEIQNAGYAYDSSLNPVYIPGRYNNSGKPRILHKEHNHWVVPASSTPLFRIPLFWLSFHHFPLSLYQYFLKKALATDGYAVLYFHPWEFIDLTNKYGLTYLTTKNTGQKMVNRFTKLLEWMVKQNLEFNTIQSYLDSRGTEKA